MRKADGTFDKWLHRVIEERSIPEPNTGCWLWTADTASGGYARAHYHGRGYRISRAILGLPPGSHRNSENELCALHRCDTRACVNPDHLFVGTFRDNARDAWHKGRGRVAPAWLGKDVCSQGHPLVPDNIILQPRPNAPPAAPLMRMCRECRRAAWRRKSQKRRTA